MFSWRATVSGLIGVAVAACGAPPKRETTDPSTATAPTAAASTSTAASGTASQGPPDGEPADDGPISLQQGTLPKDDFHARLRLQCTKAKHPPSCTLLAERFTLNNEYVKAVALYQAAGQGKDIVGWYELGTILLQGRHVPKDTVNGTKLYAKVRGAVDAACEGEGEPRACRTLGKMYLAGNIVERDETKAGEYFRKACSADDAYSCHRVAKSYQEAGGPTMVNPLSALQYNQKACDLELGAACDAVATTYQGGLAGEMDLLKARKYYELGCRYGFDRSCKTINTLPREKTE